MHKTEPYATARPARRTKGRWHDTRHTLVTELAESGAGDQTIMDIAGHSLRACPTIAGTRVAVVGHAFSLALLPIFFSPSNARGSDWGLLGFTAGV
jgi:hypothetical protein